MAKSDLPQSAKDALPYWGVIEMAAREHATTADLWSWMRDLADELGLHQRLPTVQGVSILRGMAGEIVERGRQFGELPDSRRVTGRYVTTPPWARAGAAQRALPMFHVRYQHTFVHNGEELTQWRTSVFTGRVQHTAGQLRELVALDAANLAQEYGTDHVGVDDLQVMVI